MAMIDRHLSVEQAVFLSRLEEEYQVRKKGFSHLLLSTYCFVLLLHFAILQRHYALDLLLLIWQLEMGLD